MMNYYWPWLDATRGRSKIPLGTNDVVSVKKLRSESNTGLRRRSNSETDDELTNRKPEPEETKITNNDVAMEDDEPIAVFIYRLHSHC